MSGEFADLAIDEMMAELERLRAENERLKDEIDILNDELNLSHAAEERGALTMLEHVNSQLGRESFNVANTMNAWRSRQEKEKERGE